MARVDGGHGVIVDKNQDAEGVHEDGHDGDVSEHVLRLGDAPSGIDEEEAKLCGCEAGSCEGVAILMAWESV